MNRNTQTKGDKMDKRNFYKTAFVKGLNRCCVGLKSYNEQSGMFLCVMPFGNLRWMPEHELKDFCL